MEKAILEKSERGDLVLTSNGREPNGESNSGKSEKGDLVLSE